mmetsp:Transcript_43395/g.98023  ORF Transcript_43395/g.98023 Transcript_43395/m.98023 type:complete len:246 (+) Transcript_43395:73-810(+)
MFESNSTCGFQNATTQQTLHTHGRTPCAQRTTNGPQPDSSASTGSTSRNYEREKMRRDTQLTAPPTPYETKLHPLFPVTHSKLHGCDRQQRGRELSSSRTPPWYVRQVNQPSRQLRTRAMCGGQRVFSPRRPARCAHPSSELLRAAERSSPPRADRPRGGLCSGPHSSLCSRRTVRAASAGAGAPQSRGHVRRRARERQAPSTRAWKSARAAWRRTFPTRAPRPSQHIQAPRPCKPRGTPARWGA